jgi:Bacterial archaeo-eukaryotic release factor family 10
MTKHSTTRHVNVLHDPVGDAMGWLLVLFDEERGRIFEAAPEGIVEWEQFTSRDEAVNPERRWKGMGARYGAHAQHVAAGSHADTHRAEVRREHARTVAAAVNDHVRKHPDAQIFVAGPVRDRAALIAAFPRPAVRRVAGQLSIPMFATLPEAATRFRTVLHGAPEDGAHQRRKAGRLVTTKLWRTAQGRLSGRRTYSRCVKAGEHLTGEPDEHRVTGVALHGDSGFAPGRDKKPL